MWRPQALAFLSASTDCTAALTSSGVVLAPISEETTASVASPAIEPTSERARFLISVMRASAAASLAASSRSISVRWASALALAAVRAASAMLEALARAWASAFS